MRRWISLLISTAVIALAGTALALAGSSEDGKVDADPVAVEEKKVVEPIEFEPIPKGMLESDDIPERKKVRDDVEEEPVEKPVEEPVDDTPPEIKILYPEDGQVFEKKEVVFEGRTEPGAKVFAGKYEADVNEEGDWRIVLILQKGENNVTIKAKDEAGNIGSDTVKVIYKAPQPKPEPPKDEKPKEEPKDDKPKDEEPAEWEFSAKQLYGECGEETPYDVFWGTGKPGSLIFIESKYGGGVAEIGEHGEWEIKVIFEGAPVGEEFPVYVTDKFGHKKVFEFVHTGGGEGKDH